MTASRASLALALTLLGGCLSHTRSDDPDAGPIAPDAARIDARAPGHCDAQDVRGEGGCEAEIGWMWTGSGCRSISGCSCAGSDCAELAESEEACVAAHSRCSRACGGLAGLGCLAYEYCDYPDGSFCGGDDSTGECTPRPPDCPEPGGVTVCGCDRNEYIGECSAYFAGVDVARIGPCVTTAAYDTAMAERDCGPDDGSAWRITLTTDRTSCTAAPDDGSLVLMVWHDLESTPPGTLYSLGGGVADGQALVCGRAGEPCATATGTFSTSVFAAGEVARFDFDIRTDDGRRFAATEVEIARWWCSLTPPGCG